MEQHQSTNPGTWLGTYWHPRANCVCDCRRSGFGGLSWVRCDRVGSGGQVQSQHFKFPGADGKELYGIDVRDTTWSSVGLVRLNAITGEVLARRNLNADVWFIDLTTVPRDLVPTGPVEATTNSVNSR